MKILTSVKIKSGDQKPLRKRGDTEKPNEQENKISKIRIGHILKTNHKKTRK
jgi:hypothetical protein